MKSTPARTHRQQRTHKWQINMTDQPPVNSDRTRQALEDLIDLYLTTTNDMGDIDDVDNAAPSHDRDTIPINSLAPSLDDDTEPINPLTPSLTDDTEPINPLAPSLDDDTESIHVEGVFIGHLPGLAGAWVSQYADEIAQKHGSAVICRVGFDYVELELVKPFDDNHQQHHSLQVTLSDQPLNDVLVELAADVKFWLIKCEPSCQTQQIITLFDSVTLLSCAGEAAVIGAYRELKNLTNMLNNEATNTPPNHPIQTNLMFFGCDPTDAQQAADKISRTAQSFLQLQTTVVGVRKQMQPIAKQLIGSFEQLPDGQSPCLTLVEFLKKHSELTTISDEPIAVTEPDTNESCEKSIQLDDNVAEHYNDTTNNDITDTKVTDVDATDTDAVDTNTDTAHEKTTIPNIDIAETNHDTPDTHTLAQYIDDAIPLAARCPMRQSVQLALDTSGTLHALLYAPSFDSHTTPAQYITTLLSVSSWATQHADLIALTIPDTPFDKTATPVMHLFTNQPKHFISAVYECNPQTPLIRLHLLNPITVGDITIYDHVELN